MSTSNQVSNLGQTENNIITTKPTFTVSQYNYKSPLEQQKEVEEEVRKRTMFYSQCFLTSKGPLSNIWVAGYFFKRLKKSQITETDIPSSIDKILLEGLPSVTYRVLAYLLLGVVRIHSKKVEYLYQDCDQTVYDINKFSLTKKVVPFKDIVRPSCSISLPKRYELDTFQLEVTAGAIRDHVSRNEDIILKVVDKDMARRYSLGKDRFEEELLEEELSECEELDNAQASSGTSVQQNASSSMQTPEKPASDKETSLLGHTPPDNVLSPPQQMDIDVEMSSPNRMKNLELGKEKLRGMVFGQDAGFDADRICELDFELLKLVNEYEVQNNVDGREGVQEYQDREILELENHDHVIEKESDVPSPAEKAGGSEAAGPSAETTPQFAVVPSPVKEENFRRQNKRKCIFDETTVLPNEILKKLINDASALICKRRKVPHTGLDLWRSRRLPILTNFSEPLIPCIAMELKNINHGKMETQPSFTVAIEPVETTQIPGKIEVSVSPRNPGDSRVEIAPGTPVRCSTSSRVFGNSRGEDSDGEVNRSYNDVTRNFVEEEDFGPRLMDEMDTNEDGDSPEHQKDKDGWCTRTRTVANYLHRVHQAKKQRGEDAVSLLPIVKGKTKGESARMFFEILVLSTEGFMKVKQQKAFEDVVLQETSKMEAALHNS